jgi:CheY-like chemotaxis protein
MPGMNGFELVAELSSDNRLSGVPIIVFSGLSLSIEEHGALRAAGCTVHAKGVSSPKDILEDMMARIAA